MWIKFLSHNTCQWLAYSRRAEADLTFGTTISLHWVEGRIIAEAAFVGNEESLFGLRVLEF